MVSLIQTHGFSKTLINNNGDKTINKFEWNGDYDGSVANIDVDVIKNNKKNKINLQLNNEDLNELFGTHSIEIPLEKRLQDDFLTDTYEPVFLDGVLRKRKKYGLTGLARGHSRKKHSHKKHSHKKHSHKKHSRKKHSRKKR